MGEQNTHEGKLIGVCARGERMWWPADSEQDKCPDPDCDCEPTFYRPASEVERLEREVAGYDQRWEQDNLCGICPYRKSIQSEVERLREALRHLQQAKYVVEVEDGRTHVTQVVVSPAEALPTGGITEVGPSEGGVSDEVARRIMDQRDKAKVDAMRLRAERDRERTARQEAEADVEALGDRLKVVAAANAALVAAVEKHERELQAVRGMCSDEEPLPKIDDRLGVLADRLIGSISEGEADQSG